MEHLAAAAFRELKSAGLNVEYFDYVGIIEIIIDGEKCYIYQFPELADYSTEIIKYSITRCKRQQDYITIHYEDGKDCVFYLFEMQISIHGVMYELMDFKEYYILGFIDNNLHVDCGTAWIKKEKYSHIDEILWSNNMTNMDLFTNNIDDILDSKYMPLKPRPVNIKNEGFKIVELNDNDKSDITLFTTFNWIDIVNGKYSKNKDDNILFRYINEDGELFASLLDPRTDEKALVSATQIIKVDNINKYKVKCVDELYNGYELYYKNKITMSSVYRYEYVFFALEWDSGKMIAFDARKPDSGSKTKVADVAAMAEISE